VAWTSDMRGIWTEDWLTWDQVQRFWLNIMSWLLPSDEEGNGLLQVSREGDKGHIILDMFQNWDEAMDSRAMVMAPDGGRQFISLQASQPGKYEGDFEIDQAGVYIVRVEQQKDGQVVGQLGTGLAVSYSPEYDIRNRNDIEFLERLVKETGGAVLDKPEQVFRENLQPVWAEIELWPYLMSLALILFVLDVALRRLKMEIPIGKLIARLKPEYRRLEYSKNIPGKTAAETDEKLQIRVQEETDSDKPQLQSKEEPYGREVFPQEDNILSTNKKQIRAEYEENTVSEFSSKLLKARERSKKKRL